MDTAKGDTTIDHRIRRSNIEVHSLEAPVYDDIHPEIFGSFQQRMIARDLELISALVPEDSVIHALDIGCGTGNLTLKLLHRGYQVKAVDISPEITEVLHSKLTTAIQDRVHTVIGDAESVVRSEVREMWDVVTFSSVLHHLPDYMTVLTCALQLLRDGGLLYICHEPLCTPAGTRSTKSSALDALDVSYIRMRKLVVYLMLWLRARRAPKRVDYTWSDYHAKLGIDAQALRCELESAGARTLLYETYRSRYSSVLASIDARFGISNHSHFRVILQRCASR